MVGWFYLQSRNRDTEVETKLPRGRGVCEMNPEIGIDTVHY